ncbi:uncharacterized protein LOC116415704 [Nasonia vitripennis]|uniref:Uncharacterized protein n=1 Tax=Nasonia vitripennis TaxID=7425 RepID=A0A7M7TB86_NASVI|nr:uncharacterized protein LOC116415704 [Nasonia vitripennis]XP_031788798.1 uncharacterized protein LOC116415704 [Nasonia vitripennis]XP_031788799.1 uncharacterized protein LOC116415704 [Nasonia vitripennis]XP_031788801.1 uncharacterized protein LOC116415704 [Nasonia vitripennis]XP_031788802.1 uncharacterized protein LOC116415704 [Nasonia vitripennis]
MFTTKEDIQNLLQSIIDHFDKQNSKLLEVFKQKFEALDTKVKGIDVKLINMQKDIDELKTWTVNNRPFSADDSIMTLATLAEKHKLNLPLKVLQDFDEFNLKLTLESELYKDLKAHLICTVKADNKEFLDELTKLLKKCLSREILTSHTAQRLSSTKKPIFKSTNFYMFERFAYACVFGKKSYRR